MQVLSFTSLAGRPFLPYRQVGAALVFHYAGVYLPNLYFGLVVSFYHLAFEILQTHSGSQSGAHGVQVRLESGGLTKRRGQVVNYTPNTYS